MSYASRAGEAAKPSAARWIRAADSPSKTVRLVTGSGFGTGGPGEEDGDPLLPIDGDVLQITIPAANRLHHWRPATVQMDQEVYLPLHRRWCAVPVVELQREFTLRGCDGDDVVNQRAKVSHPNAVEVVAARHLAREVGVGGGHLTSGKACTVERYRGDGSGTAAGRLRGVRDLDHQGVEWGDHLTSGQACTVERS